MVEIPKEVLEQGFTVDKQLDEVEKSAVNNLLILKDQGKKILETYEDYCKEESLRMRENLEYALNSRFNQFTQAFKDIVAFIQIESGETLRSGSLGYFRRTLEAKGIKYSKEAREVLEFLQRRNDLVHDYFNASKLNYELVKMVATYGKGFGDLAEAIEDYCYGVLPDTSLAKNISKEIKRKVIR